MNWRRLPAESGEITMNLLRVQGIESTARRFFGCIATIRVGDDAIVG